MTNTSEFHANLQVAAARILTEARNAAPEYWFGSRKVFLAAIADMSDESHTDLLEDCRRAKLLTFARADLVAAMDPVLVMGSQWDLDGSTYHFLVVE